MTKSVPIILLLAKLLEKEKDKLASLPPDEIKSIEEEAMVCLNKLKKLLKE